MAIEFQICETYMGESRSNQCLKFAIVIDGEKSTITFAWFHERSSSMRVFLTIL